MREVVDTLRVRFQECQQAGAPLAMWRELQLGILEAARRLQRNAAENEQAARADARSSRAALWAMLGDGFWLERDLTRLARLIEGVICELENHASRLSAVREA